MSTAVIVPAEEFLGFLQSKGFTERQSRHTEIVYQRCHHLDPRYRVLIYTSVRRGAAAARGVGKDAIRVCAIFDDGKQTRGVKKLPRVHRTGSVEAVLERVIGRAREAYAACNEAYRKSQPGLASGRVR